MLEKCLNLHWCASGRSGAYCSVISNAGTHNKDKLDKEKLA